MPPLDPELVDQRLRQISSLRTGALELRRAAREAWRRGEFPVEPVYDIREDTEYWQRWREEALRNSAVTGESAPGEV